jgi:hypothetical protein
MSRSAPRRRGPLSGLSRNQRIAAAATILVVFAGLVTVTRVSSAQEQRQSSQSKCGPTVAGAAAPDGQDVTTTQQNGRNVRNYWGDGQRQRPGCPTNSQQQTVNCPSVKDKLPTVPAAAKDEVDQQLAQLDAQIADANKRLAASSGKSQTEINNTILAPLKTKRAATIDRITNAIDRVAARPQGLQDLAACTVKTSGGSSGGGSSGGGSSGGGSNTGADDPNNLGIIADKCKQGSKLQLHDGFQNGNRCVDTEMGEVGTADKNPTLLITQFPQQVKANEPFTIRVSTRNLIRDRFLAAAKGGYYVEMSLLDKQGLVRGHFHTACRMLDSTKVAPDPAPVPAFFVATEDGGGSDRPDQIVINVPGLPEAGVAQCASWAGDPSHRIPMMQRANEIPAFDSVRINVTK